MKISLTIKEAELLIQATNSSEKPISLKLTPMHQGIQILDATEDILIELRDQCLDYLLMIGFDEKYKPTQEGNTLENLIDKLYTG